MRSLRGRLVLATTLAATAILAAAGVLLYALVRNGLYDQFDRALIDKARLLASAVEWEHGRIEAEFDELDMSEFSAAGRPAYLQIWCGRAILFRAPDEQLWNLTPPPVSPGAPTVRPQRLPDGRAGRVVRLAFTPGAAKKMQGGPHRRAAAPPHLTLVLARQTRSVTTLLARLEAALLAVGLIAVAGSAGVLQWVIRRSLRPVNRLGAQIAQIDAEALGRAITVLDLPTELRPVVDRLNDLLARLQAAFLRERTFSADVAHELRTPLAGLRSTMDVALARSRPAEQYREVITRCQSVTGQLQRLVEQLLALARLDAGQGEFRPARVGLRQAIDGAWRELSARADQRGLHVDRNIESQLAVQADPSLLLMACRNILENAVVHADPGGSVWIEAWADRGRVALCVANSGSQIASADAPRVFDRFWRGDTARAQTGVHSGLGLALVRQAAGCLGGTVTARSTPGGRFEITLVLPSADRPGEKGDRSNPVRHDIG